MRTAREIVNDFKCSGHTGRVEMGSHCRPCLDEHIAAAIEQARGDAFGGASKERDTPQSGDFLEAVKNEAWHQRNRWGDDDKAKTAAEWFWLVGFLAGKALHDVRGKRAHHVVAAGAALSNWYSAVATEGSRR